MSYLFEQFINGLQKGSVYALIALGYTMVYGIVKLINFAHGDFIMVGAYSTIFSIPFLLSLGLPAWLCVILAMIICALLGYATEKVAYKPLRGSKSITVLITAIAVSLLLEHLFALPELFGSSSSISPKIFSFSEPKFVYKGISIDKVAVITIVISVVIMILLNVLVKKTKIGKAMRAVSENPNAAKLMGIDIDKTVSITFLIGAGLAGLASIVYLCFSSKFNPFIGSPIGIKAFVAAVLGGIGVIPGAMLGGYIIGLIEIITQVLIGGEWADIIVFSMLVLMLLIKPTGILGKKVGEKV